MIYQSSTNIAVVRGPRAMGKKTPRSLTSCVSSSSSASSSNVNTTTSSASSTTEDKCLALASSIDQLKTMSVPRTVSPASSRAPSRQNSSSSILVSSSDEGDDDMTMTAATATTKACRRQSQSDDSCSSLDLHADPIDEAYAYHRRAAAELNNCAVALLEASQPREAVETFGEAIRAAKRAHTILEDKAASAAATSNTNDSMSSLDTRSDDDSSIVSTSTLASTSMPGLNLVALGEGITESCDAKTRAHASLDAALLQKNDSSSSTDINNTNTSNNNNKSQRDSLQRGLCGSRGLMAYTQPLRLDASQSTLMDGNCCEQDQDQQEQETAARLSSGRRDLAVIMFNMALVHHIRGCQTSSDKSFKKALTSYNIAHSVFCQSRLADGAAVANRNEGRDELLRTALLNLALLNNMGQIISELGQDDVSRQYFDGLSRLIGGTNEDVDGCPASGDVKKCWDGFEMNVLFSLSCPSPAA